MNPLFINYIYRIIIPFSSIWSLILILPEQIYPLSLFCQFFSFIYLRDSLIPTKLWFINVKIDENLFNFKFIEDSDILFILSILCLINGIIIYYINKNVLTVKILHTNIFNGIIVGIGFSLLIYYPIYMIRQLPLNLFFENLFKNKILSLANICMCLFGNFVEEILYRGLLAKYLKSYGIETLRSYIIQAAFFTILHMYLAYLMTDIGIPILLFTFYEGFICAYIENKYGIFSSTIAHGLAIFYCSIFSL